MVPMTTPSAELRRTLGRAHWCVRAVLVVLACSGAPGALAVELYRYVDENGVVVLDDNIPPRYAVNGYTVLSPTGRVLRVVPRQLTPAEIRAREEELRRRSQAERELAERYASDAELLRLYSSPEDVERARDRKLADIDGLINTTRGNIQRLKIQKRNLEIQAADMERAGQPVSPEIIENLRIIDSQIREKESEVMARTREQDLIREQYAEDLARFRELHSGAS